MTNGSRTISEIIDELGGTAAVARMTSTTAQAVSNWRTRNNIPARYWKTIADRAGGRVSLEALATVVAMRQQSDAA